MTQTCIYVMSAVFARKPHSPLHLRPSWLHGWFRRMAGVPLLLLIVAISTMASAQERPLRFTSTAWSPFTNAPQRSYELFESGKATAMPVEACRFYFGGKGCEDWCSVPEKFNALDVDNPDARSLKIKVFTFKS